MQMTNVWLSVGKIESWNHRYCGCKLLEKYHKPTFVLRKWAMRLARSARVLWILVADAIRYSDEINTKGGGHKYAAGVTLPTKTLLNLDKKVNEFYRIQKLLNQESLLPRVEVDVAKCGGRRTGGG